MKVKLIVFRKDGTRRDFQLVDGLTTLGRGSDCEVRIPLAVVSRRHAEITISDEGAVLRDLNAANGTFLNNHRVVREANLEPGDRIMVGQVIFTVQVDGKPPDDEIIKLRTTVSAGGAAGGDAARVGTSKHVYTSDDEIDPIAALEALASSADQTVIEPEEKDE
ncbi:MAG: FHA domain-containing protein [Planctomycetota bacterium]|jgi:predicted component of type VI protein secretion system